MYPLDVAKTRVQLQVKGVGEQYSGMVDCLTKIVKQEGFVPWEEMFIETQATKTVSRH